MCECWEFLFKFEKEKKNQFPAAFSWTVSERIFHLAPLTRRMPCATTSACTSALCAWRTWRGQCGQWMRWNTRNAGRRRSQGKNLLLAVQHSLSFPCEIFIRFFSFMICQKPLTCQEPALQSRLRNGTKCQLTGTNPKASEPVWSSDHLAGLTDQVAERMWFLRTIALTLSPSCS